MRTRGRQFDRQLGQFLARAWIIVVTKGFILLLHEKFPVDSLIVVNTLENVQIVQSFRGDRLQC